MIEGYQCVITPPTATPTLTHQIAPGARKAGASVDVERVPEPLAPQAVVHHHHQLLHFGMTMVEMNHGLAGRMKNDESTGSTPCGAAMIAGPDAWQQPNESGLAGARYRARAIADTAAKRHG